PRDVQRSLLVGEGVKQPAVDHRIEGATQLIELQGIADLKMDAQPPLLRLRSLDGDGDEVETPDLMPTGCQVEGVLSGAAPGVEHRPSDYARLLQPNEGRLPAGVSHGAVS